MIAEPEHARKCDLDTELRTEIPLRRRPRRLFTEEHARGVDAIATHVHERPTHQIGVQPHVRRRKRFQQERKRGPHRTQFPDRTGVDQRAHPRMLRMEAVHERFHQRHPERRAPLDGRRRLRRSRSERLLAKHGLTSGCGLDDPLGMQTVRQGDIDRVDLGIGKQLLVGTVAARDTEPRGHLTRPRTVAARDRRNHAVPRRLRAGNEALDGDIGGAENAPANACVHRTSTFIISSNGVRSGGSKPVTRRFHAYPPFHTKSTIVGASAMIRS